MRLQKVDIKISGSEEEVDMCRGIDEMVKDAREEGRAQAQEKLIRNFIREGTPYDITERCVLRGNVGGTISKDLGERGKLQIDDFFQMR